MILTAPSPRVRGKASPIAPPGASCKGLYIGEGAEGFYTDHGHRLRPLLAVPSSRSQTLVWKSAPTVKHGNEKERDVLYFYFGRFGHSGRHRGTAREIDPRAGPYRCFLCWRIGRPPPRQWPKAFRVEWPTIHRKYVTPRFAPPTIRPQRARTAGLSSFEVFHIFHVPTNSVSATRRPFLLTRQWRLRWNDPYGPDSLERPSHGPRA